MNTHIQTSRIENEIKKVTRLIYSHEINQFYQDLSTINELEQRLDSLNKEYFEKRNHVIPFSYAEWIKKHD